MGQGLPPKKADTKYTAVPSNSVRLVPGLSIAALKLKLDKELALWYCLRCINYWGSGFLDQQTAINALTDRFNYSSSAAYRILQTGDGIFWKRQNHNGINIISISSLQKVANYFKTSCGKNFFEITITRFVGSRKHRVRTHRSWLYATFYKPSGSQANPISRASIQEVTGVNRRTQQRHDRVAVKRICNYANQNDNNGRIIPKLEYVNGKNKRWLIQKQLGNSYFNLAETSARGIIRKINNAFNQSSDRREAWLNRRFFISIRSYIKCSYRCPESYIALKAKEYPLNGRMQWCMA